MKLLWTDTAWQQYLHWPNVDSKILLRINELLKEAQRDPFKGTGRPEPLRHQLKGWWSRRITEEHRLVYRVTGKGEEQVLEIVSCRFHYGD